MKTCPRTQMLCADYECEKTTAGCIKPLTYFQPIDPNPTTKREKLAMEIYVGIIRETPVDIDKLVDIKVIEMAAQTALRAADIFFEQLNK